MFTTGKVNQNGKDLKKKYTREWITLNIEKSTADEYVSWHFEYIDTDLILNILMFKAYFSYCFVYFLFAYRNQHLGNSDNYANYENRICQLIGNVYTIPWRDTHTHTHTGHEGQTLAYTMFTGIK